MHFVKLKIFFSFSSAPVYCFFHNWSDEVWITPHLNRGKSVYCMFFLTKMPFQFGKQLSRKNFKQWNEGIFPPNLCSIAYGAIRFNSTCLLFLLYLCFLASKWFTFILIQSKVLERFYLKALRPIQTRCNGGCIWCWSVCIAQFRKYPISV